MIWEYILDENCYYAISNNHIENFHIMDNEYTPCVYVLLNATYKPKHVHETFDTLEEAQRIELTTVLKQWKNFQLALSQAIEELEHIIK